MLLSSATFERSVATDATNPAFARLACPISPDGKTGIPWLGRAIRKSDPGALSLLRRSERIVPSAFFISNARYVPNRSQRYMTVTQSTALTAILYPTRAWR
jgi:hypothetical protein